MFCSKCGKEISENAAFCSSCGVAITAQREAIVQKETVPTIPTILLSHIISMLTTIISFCLRASNWEFLDVEFFMAASIRTVYGVSPDKKPIMICLPIAALMIVLLLVSFDKKLSTKKKTLSLIHAAFFAVLSILFICCTGVDQNPFNIFSRLFY